MCLNFETVNIESFFKVVGQLKDIANIKDNENQQKKFKPSDLKN